MSKNKYFKIFLINSLIFLVGFILIEIIFGNWLKQSNFSSLIIKKNIIKVWSPKHYSSNHKAMHKKDKFGFRGDYKKIEDIKILTIGGSTTDERWIDEKLTWSNKLQNKLKTHFNNNLYSVANAGIDGQSTIGHIKNFELWLKKIKNLKPKYFIFYIGINDSILLIESSNKSSSLSKYSIADNLINEFTNEKLIKYFKNNSALYNLYKIIDGNFKARKYGVIHKTESWKNISNKKVIQIDHENQNVKLFLKKYSERLKILNDYTHELNSTPIFVTQIVKKNNHLEDSLRIINDATKNFCKLEKAKCFYLDENINFEFSDDFYDDIHTRPSGNDKISDYLFKSLINL